MENLIDAAKVAELLGLRKGTVYALCRRGELPYIRLTSSRKRPLLRFKKKDVEELIRRRTVSVSRKKD